MKKIVFVALATLLMSGCVENHAARNYGGTLTVELPKGERLIEATWKETSVWYLTEPMDSTYIPTQKILREKSVFGAMEGKVIFIESK